MTSSRALTLPLQPLSFSPSCYDRRLLSLSCCSWPSCYYSFPLYRLLSSRVSRSLPFRVSTLACLDIVSQDQNAAASRLATIQVRCDSHQPVQEGPMEKHMKKNHKRAPWRIKPAQLSRSNARLFIPPECGLIVSCLVHSDVITDPRCHRNLQERWQR